jgi:mono/diheme cytochrome c family protein
MVQQGRRMLDRMLRVAAAIVVAASALSAQRSSAQDNAKVAAGETVYNTYCATCHGDNLISSGQTFDLRKFPADARPRFENSVLKGKGQMPPWQGVVSNDEIDQLWHYIRANAHEK